MSKQKRVTFPLRILPNVLEMITLKSEKDKRSISSYIEILLERDINGEVSLPVPIRHIPIKLETPIIKNEPIEPNQDISHYDWTPEQQQEHEHWQYLMSISPEERALQEEHERQMLEKIERFSKDGGWEAEMKKIAQNKETI